MQTQTLLLLTFLLPFISCNKPPSKCSSLPYPVSNHTIPLTPPLKEYEGSGVYGAQIFIGNQLFTLAVDTGSSDTWVIAEGANCTDVVTLQPVSPSECGFAGPRYEPGASFDMVDMHLNFSYGSTSHVNGPLGYTELIFGGLTIPKQEIGALSYISAGGVTEGNISGIIGLAYPSLTFAYPGTDPSKDVQCQGSRNSSCGPVPYPPFINTLFQSGLTPPVFSFALSRSSRFGGVMTIGGIPRLNDTFVNATEAEPGSTPIKALGNSTVLQAYVAEVDGFVYGNATPKGGQGLYIVDTGSMYNTFPKDAADAINALFDPPAVFNETYGVYEVSCNASTPEVGVTIGGQVFYHNPEDLIIHNPVGCYSAVKAVSPLAQAGILGASWLKSVLAIFDVGASTMTFVSRVYYEDS